MFADDTFKQCGIFTEETPTIGCENGTRCLIGKVMNRDIRPSTGTMLVNLLRRESRALLETLDSTLTMQDHSFLGSLGPGLCQADSRTSRIILNKSPNACSAPTTNGASYVRKTIPSEC
jgi:hypothetical protein